MFAALQQSTREPGQERRQRLSGAVDCVFAEPVHLRSDGCKARPTEGQSGRGDTSMRRQRQKPSTSECTYLYILRNNKRFGSVRHEVVKRDQRQHVPCDCCVSAHIHVSRRGRSPLHPYTSSQPSLSRLKITIVCACETSPSVTTMGKALMPSLPTTRLLETNYGSLWCVFRGRRSELDLTQSIAPLNTGVSKRASPQQPPSAHGRNIAITEGNPVHQPASS